MAEGDLRLLAEAGLADKSLLRRKKEGQRDKELIQNVP